MKIVHIPVSGTTMQIINLDVLKDTDDHDLELPADPENNLVFDPRPIQYDRHGHTVDNKIRNPALLIVTRTNKKKGRDFYLYLLRVYNQTKEVVPPFDSSLLYIYQGLKGEHAPYDAIAVKVHHLVTTVREGVFYGCEKMTTCDMLNAPVEVIEKAALEHCTLIKTVLFSKVLMKIGADAFSSCEAVDVLLIPSTVTNIEICAFSHCTNTRILKLPDAIDLDDVDNDIIDGCPALLANKLRNITPKKWLRERYDQYPLHKVCYNALATLEEIQKCIHDYPYVAYLSNEFDITALHMIMIIACTSNFSNHQDLALLITACFHANMSAAIVRDDRGKIPLDYLLESSTALGVHTSLVASLCMHWNASEGASSASCQHGSFKRMRYH